MYPDLGGLSAMLLVLGLAAGIWFWSDSLRAREQVTGACARVCQEMQLQFLDETVALAQLRLARSASGWLELRRVYRFEFSTTGTDRWHGRARLVARRVESIQLEHPGGVTVVGEAEPPCGTLLHWELDEKQRTRRLH